MDTLIADIRHGFRMLARSPGFTAIALLTIALGVGANTTLFSVINGVLLNPLRYPQSIELVAIYDQVVGFDKPPIAYLNFLDWQREAHTFSAMACYRGQDYNLTGTDEGERLSGYMVSSEFFSTLRIKPIIGRRFRLED